MKPMVYRSPSDRGWMWTCDCSPGVLRLQESQLTAFVAAYRHARSVQHYFLSKLQAGGR